MKKILFLFSTVLFLGACSVDEQELENVNLDIQELNATYNNGACTVTTFNYGTYGNIEVRNDRDFLYVNVNATGSNTLASTYLHIAGSFAGFPVKGKGNLQPDSMEHKVIFDSGKKQHSFKFPLENYGNQIVIASHTIFGDNTALWAGDIAVKQGNWSYFNYTVSEHPYNAGPDNSITLTVSQAKALPSWDEVRKLYAGLLAPGVYAGQNHFNPSIWDLINDFNDPTRETMIGSYSTTYTIGTDGCTDSVVLTVHVVAD